MNIEVIDFNEDSIEPLPPRRDVAQTPHIKKEEEFVADNMIDTMIAMRQSEQSKGTPFKMRKSSISPGLRGEPGSRVSSSNSLERIILRIEKEKMKYLEGANLGPVKQEKARFSQKFLDKRKKHIKLQEEAFKLFELKK